MNAREVRPFFTARRRVVVGLVVVACLVLVGQAHARQGSVQPIYAPTSLVRARAVCPVKATRTCYLTALRKAYAGLEWSKKARAHAATLLWPGDGIAAITLACHVEHVGAAVCAERIVQARCESHLDPLADNGSHFGLFQLGGHFLLDPVFGPLLTVKDPYANALVAVRYMKANGPGEWECRPDGSVRQL